MNPEDDRITALQLIVIGLFLVGLVVFLAGQVNGWFS